jgi:ADP-dependent NAD(P)H-hydrate dehydratase
VKAPEGRLIINTTGNAAMAKAGSGDVLAGMTASILAQGASAFSSAAAAVYLHGLAGDIAAEKYGKISMLPTDLINCIPLAYKRCDF